MSELKAIRSEEIYNIIEYEDCYRTDDLYYLKSEADKVIEEKDAEIAELKEHNENYRFDNKNMLNKIMIQDAELRHANYKRCLAMARRCHNESLWWYSKGYGFEKYDKFWEKWEKRWLELAEKFKPNNKE